MHSANREFELYFVQVEYLGLLIDEMTRGAVCPVLSRLV